jgi:hypothetical protein
MLRIIWVLSVLVYMVFGEIVDSLPDELLHLEYDFIIVGGNFLPVVFTLVVIYSQLKL